MKIKIRKVNENAILPKYAHGSQEDAGMDLYACISSNIELRPHIPVLVPNGISIELPPGYEGHVRPRSGLALKHGISVVNSPGTIDPSYRGEIAVILIWSGWEGNKTGPNGNKVIDFQQRFVVKPGDRIAQLVINQYVQAEWDLVDQLADSERGEAGYGSTGVATA